MLAPLVCLFRLRFYQVYGSALISYDDDNSYRGNRYVIWASLIL